MFARGTNDAELGLAYACPQRVGGPRLLLINGVQPQGCAPGTAARFGRAQDCVSFATINLECTMLSVHTGTCTWCIQLYMHTQDEFALAKSHDETLACSFLPPSRVRLLVSGAGCHREKWAQRDAL